MARKKVISQKIRDEVIAIVEQFNEENTKPQELSPMQRVMQMRGMATESKTAYPV